MKNVAILLVIILVTCFTTTKAQSPSSPMPVHTRTRQFKIDQNSVVKDASGKIYAYDEWMKIMKTGDYSLVPESMDADSPAFILTKNTPKQKEAFLQNQAKYANAAPVKFIQPGENSIVKDSTGMQYPYIVWRKLMMSGDYNLRQMNYKPDSVTYILSKKTQQQKDEMMTRIPKPEESKQFRSGDVFNPFRERDMNGEKLDLKKMPGKVFVLNFWFIGCPPCRAEIPELTEMANKYKNNPDVVFIAVALDQSYDLKDFLKDHPLSYHVIDNGRYIADKYGVHLYPTNVVIDKDSKVAYSSEGGHPNNIYWMEKTINAALASAQKTTAAQ